MRARVLLGFANALACPEAIFSLVRAGFDVAVLSRRGDRAPLVARRLPVSQIIEITPPEVSATQSIEDLRCADVRGFQAALALDDAALWLFDKAIGTEGPLRLAGATGDAARFALDKRLQFAVATKAGFAVPETFDMDDSAGMDRVRSFPAIAKPARALDVINDKLVKGRVTYLACLADLEALRAAPLPRFPTLVQPLIAGGGEGVFGFRGSRGTCAWSAHQRVRMMNPHGSGASACRSIEAAFELRTMADKLVGEICWSGPFMIELLRDSAGTAWFIEFNGRLWGSTALARRQGFEYPAWAVSQALDPNFEPPPIVAARSLEVRHLGRELLHLLFVLRGPKSDFHARNWPRFSTSLSGVLRPGPRRSFYNFDVKWPNFFLYDAFDTLSSFVRGQQ